MVAPRDHVVLRQWWLVNTAIIYAECLDAAGESKGNHGECTARRIVATYVSVPDFLCLALF